MGSITEVHGMELSAMPVGEYDRRIVLLTKERGKISAFAKGARRPNSPLMGVTRAFVFGTFQMYEGRTSYTLKQANITNFFEEILTDYSAVCYACYFAELADYYARENLDATDMINLLYVTLKALTRAAVSLDLIKCIYELRLISINGECVDLFACKACGKENQKLAGYSGKLQGLMCTDCSKVHGSLINCSPSTVYALQYIITAPIDKLYTFTLSAQCLAELEEIVGLIVSSTIDKKFKSLDIMIEERKL